MAGLKREAGVLRVRAGQLDSRRELLKYVGRLAQVDPRFRRPSHVTFHPRAEPQGIACPDELRASRWMASASSSAASASSRISSRSPRRPTAPAAPRAARARACREPQRAPVLVQSFAVRTDRRGVLGRDRAYRNTASGSPAASADARPGKVRRSQWRLGERRQRPTMQDDGPVRRERFLDRQPRQLMPERDTVGLAAQHPRLKAFVQTIQRPLHQLLKQPHLRPLRDDRDGLEHVARRAAQPRSASQHRVANRWRNPPLPAARTSVK